MSSDTDFLFRMMGFFCILFGWSFAGDGLHVPYLTEIGIDAVVIGLYLWVMTMPGDSR